MTEQQAKRRDELAEAWSSKARMFKVGDDLFAHAFRDGYDACAKDAEGLVTALDRAIEVIEFCYMGQPKTVKEITEPKDALAKWRGPK